MLEYSMKMKVSGMLMAFVTLRKKVVIYVKKADEDVNLVKTMRF